MPRPQFVKIDGKYLCVVPAKGKRTQAHKAASKMQSEQDLRARQMKINNQNSLERLHD